MKRLIMVRHAKSSWEHDVKDKERPLKNRGNTDAELISKYFSKLNYEPEIVYSSPANRAYSTCKIFMKNMGRDLKNVEIVENLYTFSSQNVLRFLHSINNNRTSVMIFGHNDAFNDLVNELGSESIGNFPTCGLAIIDFETDDWKNIKNGITQELITPKQLKNN